MKKIFAIAVMAVMFLTGTSVDASAQLSNLFKKNNTSTTATQSEAYNSGSASGKALKALYTQYKADGKKIDMTNMSNILNLASLATSIQGIKGQKSNSSFYKDFTKGMILGSTNLVNNTNSSSIMSGLNGLANLDLSSLTSQAAELAKQKATDTAKSKIEEAIKDKVTTGTTEKAAETVQKGQVAIENATEISNSVSNILKLFK